MHIKFSPESLNGRNYFGDMSKDVRIILKWSINRV
jgi:hypothetical protein